MTILKGKILTCLAAFAIAQEAQKAGASSGSFPCPGCSQPLAWSAAPGNGHLWGQCKTENCVRFMQ
ncbi:hypothetical protein [Taklimakanibacter albus]|uniref:Uncharacterized protein n=1 Tax=Taklimakanibacter albus TaxID=2800327 RepID=A0ACC5R6I5_9HYPH|nr:hypothetical protein [Aestuariivirga sp. YIM B02566]MBK1868280.1 hypothetical protein [Aestuariivirga sp. YIM B02566]